MVSKCGKQLSDDVVVQICEDLGVTCIRDFDLFITFDGEYLPYIIPVDGRKRYIYLKKTSKEVSIIIKNHFDLPISFTKLRISFRAKSLVIFEVMFYGNKKLD